MTHIHPLLLSGYYTFASCIQGRSARFVLYTDVYTALSRFPGFDFCKLLIYMS
jgi:hypothetical protein